MNHELTKEQFHKIGKIAADLLNTAANTLKEDGKEEHVVASELWLCVTLQLELLIQRYVPSKSIEGARELLDTQKSTVLNALIDEGFE